MPIMTCALALHPEDPKGSGPPFIFVSVRSPPFGRLGLQSPLLPYFSIIVSGHSNFLEMEMANKVGPHTISMDCPVCLAGTLCKRVTSDDIDDSCRNCDSTLSTGRAWPGPAYNYWPLALALNGLNSGTLAQKSIPKNSTPGLFFL